MGVNISDIIVRKKAEISDFKGKWIAVDAYNTLYQFLSIIRQPDGTPLMDSEGRVTSHLTGLLYRISNFLEAGIKPVFVFDGIPPDLKADTLNERRQVKERIHMYNCVVDTPCKRRWLPVAVAPQLPSNFEQSAKLP